MFFLMIFSARLLVCEVLGFAPPPFPPLTGVASTSGRCWVVCDLSGRRWQQCFWVRVGIAAPMPL